jgi:hypothetical protein
LIHAVFIFYIFYSFLINIMHMLIKTYSFEIELHNEALSHFIINIK